MWARGHYGLALTEGYEPFSSRSRSLSTLSTSRSVRRSLSKSRTSEFGFDTILVLEPTTCTRSSVSCPVPTLSMLVTKIWLPDTVLDSDLFRYVDVQYMPETRLVLIAEPSLPFLSLRQILRVAEIEKNSDIRRPHLKQLLTPNLRFPLPHRVVKSRSLFLAKRPSTFY